LIICRSVGLRSQRRQIHLSVTVDSASPQHLAWTQMQQDEQRKRIDEVISCRSEPNSASGNTTADHFGG
jgi:hypothetical protein